VLIVPDSDNPAATAEASYVISTLAFRFLLAIDIEDFSRLSVADQARSHDHLEYAMSEAAVSAALDRKLWYRQPRGDGELAVLHADADGLSLVADYPRSLASALAEVNRSPDRCSRLRVRVAIHHGTVYPGRFGPVGGGPITVSRLVDAPVLRKMLKQRPDLDIALIVSAAVYDEVVQTRFHELDPKMFHRTNITIKRIRYVGYLYFTDLMRLADAGCVLSCRAARTNIIASHGT
jgi:class 3 adenylate cyclase